MFEKNKMSSMLLHEVTSSSSSSSSSSIRRRVQEQDIAVSSSSISKITTTTTTTTTTAAAAAVGKTSRTTNSKSSGIGKLNHNNNNKEEEYNQNQNQSSSLSLTNTYTFIKTKSSPPKERQRRQQRQQQKIDTSSLSPFDFHPINTSSGYYISGSDHSNSSNSSSSSNNNNNNNNNNSRNNNNNNVDYKFVTTTSDYTNTTGSSLVYQPTESSIGPYDHRILDPPSLLQSSLSFESSSSLSLPLPTAYTFHRTGATVSVDNNSSSSKNISTADQQLYSESITLKEEETNTTMNSKYTKTATSSSSSRPAVSSSSQLQQQQQQQNDHSLYQKSDNESSSQVDSESYLDFNEAAAQMYPQNYYYPSNNNNNHNNTTATTRGVGNIGDDTSINMTYNQQQQQQHQNYNTNQQQQQQQQRNSHHHSTIIPDATDIVHEMHLALLYLLSNPEEFSMALNASPQFGTTTLEQWNAEYDNESLVTAETEYTGGMNTNNNDKKGILSTKGTTTTATNNNTTTKATGHNDDLLSPASTKDSQSILTAANPMTTPLPYVVFADDAEVVLPQAHTASQLFGIERLEGIELEAAAGIPALCQLFLRWLALMPGGDHLNIIDPPGLTVMRIAGGRYRVTGAHRVVWTWMNEFAQLTFNSTTNSASVTTKSSFASNHTINNQNSNTGSIAALSTMSSPTLKTFSAGCVGGSGVAGGTDNHTSLSSTSNRRKADGGDAVDQLQIGDLVSMTIVDVFETDSDGKLLSYCPTFDNRAIVKTNATTEVLRKSSTKVLAAFNRAQKSKLAVAVASHATTLASRLKKQVDKAVYGENTGSTTSSQDNGGYLYDTTVLSSPPTSNRQRHDSRDGDDYDVVVKQQQQHFVQNLPSFSDNSSGIPTAAFDIQQQPHTSHVSNNRKTSKFNNNNNSKLDDTINTTTTTTSYIGDDDLERHEI